MPRRRAATTRVTNPDAKYGNEILAKFMNCLMERGKKATAESIVYGALDILAKNTKRNPLEVILEAIESAIPLVEVRSRRVGGATYQVPVEVRRVRGLALSIRWIIAAARKRHEKTMAERLAAEIMEILAGRGGALKEKETKEKMAAANKAFSHFRW